MGDYDLLDLDYKLPHMTNCPAAEDIFTPLLELKSLELRFKIKLSKSEEFLKAKCI